MACSIPTTVFLAATQKPLPKVFRWRGWGGIPSHLGLSLHYTGVLITVLSPVARDTGEQMAFSNICRIIES